MTLYEIDSALAEAIENYEAFINEETGEFDEQGYQQAISEIESVREEKIENIAKYIINLGSEAEEQKTKAKAFEDRAKVHKERATAAENKIKSLKKYLAFVLNGEKFKTSDVSVSFRKNESVNPFNIDLVPDEFCKFTKEPRKTDIKKAIKEGKEVAGCELVTTQSVIVK